MLHPFDALRADYTARYAAASITRPAAAAAAASRLLLNKPRYQSVAFKTGVPAALLMAIGEREAGTGVFHCYFGDGEPIIGTGRKSTLVPAGRGPFTAWEDGALDALSLDGLDRIAAVTGGWNLARVLYEAELYNGFGYRQFSIPSPYLWAGTDQYRLGKYRSDGKFDPALEDEQLGVVPILKALIARDPSLAIPVDPRKFVAMSSPVTTPATPIGVGGIVFTDATGFWTIRAIQAFLNDMGQTPAIAEDNSFGKETKRAVAAWQAGHALDPDGYAGPKTVPVMAACLAEAQFYAGRSDDDLTARLNAAADQLDAAATALGG